MSLVENTEIISVNVRLRPRPDDRYLLINFKTYKESTGSKAVDLAKAIDRAAADYSVKVMIAPSIPDIYAVSQAVENVHVISQHLDPVSPGAHTGSIPIRVLAEYGVSGSLLNHSERPISFPELSRAISLLRQYSMWSIVCTPDVEASRMASYVADFVAFEDPELIGTGVSVSKAKPEVVRRNIEAINSGLAIPLVGAGISTAEDVIKSIELGAYGVLVASAIVKAKDPEAKTREFLDALIKL